MFLRCSYFFQNLSLDVLINKVLIQSNACTVGLSVHGVAHPFMGQKKCSKVGISFGGLYMVI